MCLQQGFKRRITLVLNCGEKLLDIFSPKRLIKVGQKASGVSPNRGWV